MNDDFTFYKHNPNLFEDKEEGKIYQIKGQKCDICGSTTIDHTEAQCQINRLSKKK